MAHNNRTNKITHLLVYALLEWTLIIFLLFNSLSTYLIIKFADYFRLKRPCLCCSTLHHRDLLFSKDPVCKINTFEFLRKGYCSHHGNPTQSQSMCDRCSWNSSPTKRSVLVIQDDDEKIDSCENESLLNSAGDDDEVQETGIEDGSKEEAISELGIAVSSEDPFNFTGDDEDHDNLIENDTFELIPFGDSSSEESVVSEIETNDSIDTLKWALRAERKRANALRMEVEKERSTSSFAADETLAMISRLQEEKAAMKMEALQYRRMMEEQSEYEREALHVLNEIMVMKEKSRRARGGDLGLYRKKV